MDANGGWQSQMTLRSIYSPRSARRKYNSFLPKKALLHSISLTLDAANPLSPKQCDHIAERQYMLRSFTCATTYTVYISETEDRGDRNHGSLRLQGIESDSAKLTSAVSKSKHGCQGWARQRRIIKWIIDLVNMSDISNVR